MKIQVQAVLYNNDKQSVISAVSGIANAVRIYREREKNDIEVRFVFGDSSASPVFCDSDVTNIRERFAGELDFDYKFFGFNSGYGKGNNILAESSGKCDYYIIMNPDIIVTPTFFINILKPFGDGKVGLVEARQTPVEHQKEYDISSFETKWATGACIAVRKELFDKLGGFDADTFFMYCEDVDFSWRLRSLGYKIIYQPTAVVFHSKFLNDKGGWVPSETEKVHSLLSALLLAYKWNNAESFNSVYDVIEKSSEKHCIQAMETFNNMKKSGKLPKIIKGSEVAEFINDGGCWYYCENRFKL